MFKRSLLSACGALLLTAGCAEVQTSNAPTASEAFLEFTEQQAKVILQEQPLFATSLGVSEEYVGKKFGDILADHSVASVERAKQYNTELSEQLTQFDRAQLEGTAATTYDVLTTTLAMAAQFKPYLYGSYSPLGIFSPYTVTQLSGPHIEIARSLQTEHPLESAQDAEDYVSRLNAMRKALTGTASIVELEAEKGLTPPKFALEGAINVINGMTNVPANEHPLSVSFAKRFEAAKDVDAETRAQLQKRVVEAIENQVYPGYAALKSSLEKAADKAQTEAGVWAIDHGTHLYELALQNYGASGKSAEDVHQLGLKEVARIHQEMDAILKSQGHTEGSIMERYIAVSEDKKFIYPNTDDGRQTLLDDLNKQMKEVEVLLPEILVTLPKAPVEVRRIAEYEQDSAPGGYYTGPSLDGSRPGIYWINLKDTADWPSFTLPTLTYHEASPGHHLQVTIAQEISDMPMLRNMLWFSQYGEGWALYAESLAKELGLYKDDPYGDLGRLQSELFRAGRLVVDTGLHYKKWNREQAIEWMHNNTGESVAAVTREVERYSVWPGQATSYKLGQIRIFELRAMAKEALGNKFDLREFNDQLLIKGAVPLPVLEANIKAWIQTKKTS